MRLYLGHLFANVFPMAGALNTFKDLRSGFSDRSQQPILIQHFFKRWLPPTPGPLRVSVGRSSRARGAHPCRDVPKGGWAVQPWVTAGSPTKASVEQEAAGQYCQGEVLIA